MHLSQVLGCSTDQAYQWLGNASPFARYLIAKHSARANHERL